MRRGLGVLFIAYGILLAVQSTLDGSLPNVLQLLIALFGVALIANLGRVFLRDWTLVLAGVAAYMLGARYTQSLDMPIHYTPQIDAERVLGLGVSPDGVVTGAPLPRANRGARGVRAR